MKQPVFVVGAPRSGTTLIYSIILSSGEYPIYETETKMLSVCKNKYGKLDKQKNYEKFIRDWTNSRQFYRSGLDPDFFAHEAKKYRSSYINMLDFFMEQISNKQNKQRWVEKTPGHIHYILDLQKYYPDAKFIHVIRDGRDVALSRRKLGWVDINISDKLTSLLWLGTLWRYTVEKGTCLGHKIGINYKEIFYENIITDPDRAIEELNKFLGIKINYQDVINSKYGVIKDANTAYSERMNGISHDALKRWKQHLTDNEILAINESIGPTLKKYGYEVTKSNLSATYAKHKWYVLKNLLLFRLKHFLKNYTALGRCSRDTLEIGLE